MPSIRLKRAYESATPDDGFRVLVDRLWPRGISREEARIDLWLKDAAPTTELRKWFDHDPAKWDAFSEQYGAQLDADMSVLDPLRGIEGDTITLVFGARDVEHTHALVLLDRVERFLAD